MLVELRVRDLGVIEDLVIRLGPGMTALTGETGAGKTLLVEALDLLVGGRADPSLVRSGSRLALVEGRFLSGETELVLCREVPAEGRTRAYIDGRMATASGLAEAAGELVDLHGQHSHQSLLHLEAQRRALDRYAGVSTEEIEQARDALARIDERLGELGGDERSLASEVDLLRFQLEELERAALSDPDEETALLAEEKVLAQAGELREAAATARDLLSSDEKARDLLTAASSALARHEVLAPFSDRLTAVVSELDDLSSELRSRAEAFEDDPERLEAVQERRRLLAELRRKYGESLAAVITFRDRAKKRLSDLEAADERREALSLERRGVEQELARAEQAVGDARRGAAPRLAGAVETILRSLALPNATFGIRVPPRGAGAGVEFLFGANTGEPPQPLAKVASGGELARAMLATRLVMTDDFPTLVFDEVDAGVGGQAALAVGRALAQLGERHQVLVVTHLAQVAAFATDQIAVEKKEVDGRTVTTAALVEGEERLIELSRMLSGHPSSEAARRHARELLEAAGSASSR